MLVKPTLSGRLRRSVFSLSLLGAAATLLFAGRPAPPAPRTPPASKAATAGALTVIDKEGHPGAVCPLKHTKVDGNITGPLARVTVTQQFENPFRDNIEAVYTFPLPQNAAVDDMTMKVGDRTIRGLIKKREEARKIYEQARQSGHTASLLDQERPNIFTQSVTNIGPGMKVEIVISYVETLKYEAGTYEFAFPMVVGPRYIPGTATGQTGGGWSPDTDRVPDASRVTPQVTPPGTRAGHDLSLALSLNAGVPIDALSSHSHEVDIEKTGPAVARVRLRNQATLPNKDFVLRWDVAGRKIEDALLTHRASRGGFFTFLLQPPERPAASEITPKEIVFVIDTSGSMSGFPLEKTKEVIKLAMDNLNPRDTFNLITFSGDTHILFPQPVPASAENVRRAQQFLLSRTGGGGTEMMKAIRAALDPTDSQEHLRIVCFMTDGYVGNDMEIIGEIQRHANARVFSFGVGSSVNRFLLDKMSEAGRGEVEYVALNDDGSKAARRFHERVHTPLLTDISIEWNGLPVSDVYPKRIPDLFAAKPLVLTGRYHSGAKGTLRLRGKVAGRNYVRDIAVDLPGSQPERDVLATLWARTRIDNLMSQDWNGLQSGNPKPEIKDEITNLGLEFRLMTQFTSFVAVEEKRVVEGGTPRVVQVPVEMPHGVSYEGVFGSADRAEKAALVKRMTYAGAAMPMAMPAPPPSMSGRRDGGANQASVLREQEAPREGDRLRDVSAKLAPELQALLQGRGLPSYAASSMQNGKVKVKIWLTSDAPAAIAALRQVGLEFTGAPANRMLSGSIAVAKLADLAKLGTVQFVSLDLGQPR
jgi:Ca-activated chloride channel family protein